MLVSLFKELNISFFVKLGYHTFMMSSQKWLRVEIFFADGGGSGGHFLWIS